MPALFRSPLTVFSFLLVVALFVVTAIFTLEVHLTARSPDRNVVAPVVAIIPFPVGVDPKYKSIIENLAVDSYMIDNLAIDILSETEKNLAERLLSKLQKANVFQQLAAAIASTLVVYPGQRKEEVAKNFAEVLGWEDNERVVFQDLITSSIPELSEGKFFPGRYSVPRGATPEVVAALIISEFSTEVMDRYDASVEDVVPLQDTLIIASLLEREAYDFVDMRIISGIIWNRLFINMPLQLDASLQYAKGSLLSERKWWPQIKPSDKYIESPFNTYQETGLPPAPIANPSLEAVVAALNPKVTSCLFYFHEDDGTFHCSDTYEEHVAWLRALYGQGS